MLLGATNKKHTSAIYVCTCIIVGKELWLMQCINIEQLKVLGLLNMKLIIIIALYISVTKAIAGMQIRALLQLLGCLFNN